MKVAVYGLGNFGYAITKHLTDHSPKEFSITAFDRNPEVVNSLTKHRKHPFLHREHTLDKRAVVVSDCVQLVKGADIIILAVSSSATYEVLSLIKNHIADGVIIVNTAKALETNNGEPLSIVVDRELSGKNYEYSVIAGGTIASDLFEKQPLGVDIASSSPKVRNKLKKLFASDNLAVYTLTDVLGVELAGAFKNVAAILAGIMYGRGFSYGSETHIISLAAKELENLAVKMGAKRSTFAINRQCWGNDLIMSCTGNTRNREYGSLLGKGFSANEALKVMGKANKTVEGVNTIRVLSMLLEHGDYKILKCLNEIIEYGQSVDNLAKVIFRSKKK